LGRGAWFCSGEPDAYITQSAFPSCMANGLPASEAHVLAVTRPGSLRVGARKTRGTAVLLDLLPEVEPVTRTAGRVRQLYALGKRAATSAVNRVI
jgi:hypothetical protein